jgi:hypothetical protein
VIYTHPEVAAVRQHWHISAVHEATKRVNRTRRVQDWRGR